MTKLGAQVVHDNFRRPEAVGTNITAGAIIGHVSGGNIQSVANAYESTIQQLVNQSDAEGLRQTITETLEKLVAEVSDQLTMQQKIVYMQAAAAIEQEIAKAEPDTTVLEKALRTLTLGDTMNGVLDLGIKTYVAVTLASPYVGVAAHAIERLLRALAP